MDTAGPLDGVRVVDFTHILAGPFCTQLLADAGATVIKVEPPAGEFARVRGQRRVGDDGTEVSSYSAAVNRGKRSIAIDLKNASGLEVARRLALSADVAVENFAPGALARLGLDFKALRKQHPRLISTSISLYGGSGTDPLATRGGLSVVAEGESSITSMTRDRDGMPVMLGLPLGDMATALAAYAAITTALYERTRTDVGRHLEISMVGTLWSLNAIAATGAQINADARLRRAPAAYGIFPTVDGHVTIGVNNDPLFRRAVTAMGMPELADDPRYSGFAQRDLAATDIDTIVSQWTSGHTTNEVITILADFEVPCGRVATPADLLGDDQSRRLGYVQTVDDGIGGTIDTPANPMGFHRSHSAIPRLAANTDQILAEIGIQTGELTKLRAAGAFG